MTDNGIQCVDNRIPHKTNVTIAYNTNKFNLTITFIKVIRNYIFRIIITLVINNSNCFYL